MKRSMSAQGKKRLRKRADKRVSFGKKQVIFTVAVIAAVSLVSTAVYYVLNRSVRYDISKDGWIYQYGDRYPVSENSCLVMEKSGMMVLTDGENQRLLDATPVYFEDSENPGFLIPTDILYMDPRRDEMGKLPAGTLIHEQEGSFGAEWRSRSKDLYHGFLFDGGNIYIFLEDVTVRFHKRSLEMPSMSYVRVVPGGQIELFNYQTRESVMEDLSGDATAVCKDYILSLNGDTITYSDGVRMLLVNEPSVLESLMGR